MITPYQQTSDEGRGLSGLVHGECDARCSHSTARHTLELRLLRFQCVRHHIVVPLLQLLLHRLHPGFRGVCFSRTARGEGTPGEDPLRPGGGGCCGPAICEWSQACIVFESNVETNSGRSSTRRRSLSFRSTAACFRSTDPWEVWVAAPMRGNLWGRPLHSCDPTPPQLSWPKKVVGVQAFQCTKSTKQPPCHTQNDKHK